MAEDFTSYTEVDPNSHITVTSTKVSTAALGRDEEAYVYDDKGAGNIGGTSSFNHWVDVEATSATGAGLVVHWGVANSIDDFKGVIDAGDGEELCVYLYNGGTKQLILYEVDGGSVYSDAYTMLLSTTYYLDINYDPDVGTYGTITCDVYTSVANRADKASAVANLSLTLHTSVKSYQYLYAIQAYNDSTTPDITGFTENLITTGSTGVVGQSAYASSLPLPPQHGLWNDGLYLYVLYHSSASGTATQPQVAFGDASTKVFGAPVDIPYVGTSARGYGISSWYTFHQTYKTLQPFVAYGSNGKTVSHYKNNDDFGTTKMSTPFEGTVSAGVVDEFPTVVIDKNDYVWVGGRELTSGTYYIKVQRASDPFETDAFDSATTLKTLTSALGIPQLVTYSNGDLGCLYSDNNTSLYYRHYTLSTDTWESEETIASADLTNYYNFRGVVTRDGHLYVVWKTATTSTISYRIRDLDAGTWNTTADSVTDAGSVDTGFTTTADVGQDEKVLFYYWDGTNIAKRTIEDTTVSSKTTFVSAPSLKSYLLIAPPHEHELNAVGYHTTDDYIRVETDDLTPTRKSTVGTEVTLDGSINQSLEVISQHMVSAGDKTLVMWTGRDGRGYLRVRDTGTHTWDQAAVAFTKRYWDMHNTMTIFKDDSDIVYITFGGRDANGTTEYIEVWKSDFALDHGSFTLDKETDWTDISPSTVTGRGYKLVIVDNNGIPHLFDISEAGTYSGAGPIRVREYRTGSWSAVANLADTDDAASPYDHIYVHGVVLGDEAAGQKSIHLTWSYRDKSVQPAVTGGSILNNEINYMKIVPQGGGSPLYKVYDAAGTEFTLGGRTSFCDIFNKDTIYSGETTGGLNTYESYTVKTYTADDFVIPTTPNGHVYKVTTGGAASVEPTWPTDHFNTVVDGAVTFTEYGLVGSDWVRNFGSEVVVINNTTPCVLQTRCSNTSTYDMTEVLFTKWDATNWTTVQVENTGFPWFMSPKVVVGSDGIFIAMQKETDGVSEIVVYQSIDDGDTWTAASNKTSGSSFDNYYPLLTPRSTTSQNLIWMQRVHDIYSEVMFDLLVVSSPSLQVIMTNFYLKRRRVTAYSYPSFSMNIERITAANQVLMGGGCGDNAVLMQ